MLIWVYNYHQWKNQSSSMFENPKLDIWDDLMKPFQVMKKYFSDRWHEMCSIVDYPIEKFDALLFIEFPTLPFLLNKYFRKWLKLNKKMYLLLMESEIIRPSNFKTSNHKYFEKIFTWKDSLVDNKKYVKICIPQNIPNKIEFNNNDRKFCTLIASYKLHDHKYELYSERVNAIRFFEKIKADFDLYWSWWNYYTFQSHFVNKYSSLLPLFWFIKNLFHKLFFKHFPSWKWKVDSKFKTLSKYKFAICYENAKSIPWYITEKIFDCFFAWCIPIYLWAPNIYDFVPKDTFIDKNNFKNYDDLYEYLKNMTKNTYEGSINNIKEFLISDEIKKFDSDNFSSILYKNIVN